MATVIGTPTHALFLTLTASMCLQAELERKGPPVSNKTGVCLEYLKGTCNKGDSCPFSHSLKDYYIHVCKRKPHACIAKKSVSESLLAALVADNPENANHHVPNSADRCKRSYVLRCLIPTLIPGDPKRTEALIAALVFFCRCMCCLMRIFCRSKLVQIDAGRSGCSWLHAPEPR
jgi:hypothetical protein